jgi:hypothetical protein
MCYSPEVSFGSAAGLLSVGAYTLRTALRRARWFWPLAVVPCLFGVQQASEGFVWVGLDRNDARLVQSSATVYLFFAVAFWPTWFSLAAALIEPQEWKRRWLFLWAALSTVWFFAIYLPMNSALDATAVHVVGHSIRYEATDPGVSALGTLDVWLQRCLYVFTVTVPTLAATPRRVLFVPVSLSLVSGVAAAILFDHAFTSIWCLWCAFVSATLVYSVVTAPSEPAAA